MSQDSIQLGYCTNVHAGTTLENVIQNIREFSLPIKQSVAPTNPFGIGLWFNSSSADQLSTSIPVWELRDQLNELGLTPFTFNGFPFGDFHSEVVKHEVYLPTWADDNRFMYTVRLAKIQSELLPEGSIGSISTLPLGWPIGEHSETWTQNDEELVNRSAENLRAIAAILQKLEENSGRKIQIAIEPEPGCVLDNSVAIKKFFTERLFTGKAKQDDIIREYIGVCHDVCHSAVMFESQQKAIESYTQDGLQVFKVQASSAIEIPFDEIETSEHEAALNELRQFQEPRYLHQVNIQRRDGQLEFFEDLDLALAKYSENPQGTWRVHFHVPIFLEKFNFIRTTQPEIARCWQAMRKHQPECLHFEVETYAWNVMADQYKTDSLIQSTSRELHWFRDQFLS